MSIDIKRIAIEYDQRIKMGFEQVAGKDLVREEILDYCEPGRPKFARHYSYVIINFAMKVFYLAEEKYYDTANKALIENCIFYIENKECRDDRDSFYWSIDIFCRIVEFFGSNGSIAKGRLTAEAENKFLEMAFCWCKNNSDLTRAEFENCKTWNIWESENHHIQGFSTCWHLSKLLLSNENTKNLKYDDQNTPDVHFEVWGKYIQQWLSQRGKKSLFVEIANGHYAAETLKGVYNIFDFTQDSKTKELAKALLDLYWASWAQEQLNGVFGGGKTRVYPDWAVKGKDGLFNWAWYYTTIGKMEPIRLRDGNDFTIMTSSYRIPELFIDIAVNPEERGVYEIKQRPLGLAKEGYYINPDYQLKHDWGGIYRYSYCSPKFIVGSLMLEPHKFEEWALISSQNRFQGAIFSSHNDARIVPVPECMSSDNTPIMRSYNQHYTAQLKGTMITQKLKWCVDVGKMRVWFSSAGGLDDIMITDNWIFSKTDGAYAAVFIADGGFEINSNKKGKWLVCNNEWSPVIMEVVSDTLFKDFNEFIDKILLLEVYFDNECLKYTSIYNDKFVFYRDSVKQPVINGQDCVKKIDKAFDSPFINGYWDDGIVTVKKGDKEMILNFNI